MLDVTEAASWVVLVVAGLTAAGVAFKWLRGGFKTVEDGALLLSMTADIQKVIRRELNHNHGSSLKDDVHGIAISVHSAHQRIDEFHDLFRTFAEANSLVLPIIADAIRSTPPPEREVSQT